MSISTILRAGQTLVKHNAPAILTGVAVAGTFTVAVLGAQAGYKAAQVLSEKSPYLTTREKVEICWPLFIPVVGVGMLTVTCALGANHLSARKAAALASAYSLSERAFSEYKSKIVEAIGDKKEMKVRDELAQEQVDKTWPVNTEIIITDSSDVVCYETMSGRYFSTTVEKIKQGRNEFNARLINQMYGSLNQFWDTIGLEGTTMGEEVGWTVDSLFQEHITTTLAPDGKPCLSLGYINAPKVGYYKFR